MIYISWAAACFVGGSLLPHKRMRVCFDDIDGEGVREWVMMPGGGPCSAQPSICGLVAVCCIISVLIPQSVSCVGSAVYILQQENECSTFISLTHFTLQS